MKNTKWLRFAQSLIILPMTTMSGVPVGPISQVAVNIVKDPDSAYLQKLNIEVSGGLTFNDAKSQELEVKTAKAEAIDSYFRERKLPLAGMGMTMVEEAESYELDWRLIAAIAMRESTGGKFACKKVPNNPFGWGSCKIGFKSNEDAIATIARNLGGKNPRTAHYYGNKTTIQILRAYNPPSIVPKYAQQVISIMDTIGPLDWGDKKELAFNI